MNKDQATDKANMGKGKTREVGGQATDDPIKDQEGKNGKHSNKSGAVLGEINDDPKKKSK